MANNSKYSTLRLLVANNSKYSTLRLLVTIITGIRLWSDALCVHGLLVTNRIAIGSLVMAVAATRF